MVYSVAKNQYYINSDAYENNPYAAKAKKIKNKRKKEIEQKLSRFWEGIKHIYDCQNRVTINNYHSLGKQYGYSFTVCKGMHQAHVKNGWLELKY